MSVYKEMNDGIMASEETKNRFKDLYGQYAGEAEKTLPDSHNDGFIFQDRKRLYRICATLAACLAAAVILGIISTGWHADNSHAVSGTSLGSYGDHAKERGNFFTLVAYAAELDGTECCALPSGSTARDGSEPVVVRAIKGNDGVYTEYSSFGFDGENIKHITAELSKGSFYRLKTDSGNMNGYSVLGNKIDEEYDKNCFYGIDFFKVGEEMAAVTFDSGVYDDTVKAELAERSGETESLIRGIIDEYSGESLTINVTYADGTSEQKIYTLSTGYLALGSDGSPQPRIVSGGETFCYGIVASPTA